MIKIALNSIVAMALFLSNNCGSPKKNNKYSIKSITVAADYDLVTLDKGELINIQDSFSIIYYQNFVLFQLPYINEVAAVTVKNDTIEEKIIKSEMRYKLYLFKPDQAYGYRYDSINAISKQLFSVDSFLTAKAFIKTTFFDERNDSLIETAVNPETKILTEKYVPRIKHDETYPDSTYLYFSNQLKNVKFSFSRYLDNIKNRKLFKVVFIYNPLPKGVYDFDVPERKLMFEIKKAALIDSTEIVDFIERAKRSAR